MRPIKVIQCISAMLLFSSLLFSQQKEVSSVIIGNIQKKSEHLNKYPAFYKAKEFYFARQWDSTLLYTMKQLSKPSNNTEVENFSRFLRASSFKSKGVLDEAKQEFLQITPDFEFMNLVKMMLGEVAFSQHEYNEAIRYFKTFELLKDDELIGLKKSNIEENIGACYMHLEQYDEAEKYFLKSIANVETRKDTVAMVASYMNIASFYYNQYKDDKAIPFFKKAYQLSKLIPDFESKQDAAFNMAIVEKNRKDFQKSVSYLEEHIRWKDSLNN